MSSDISALTNSNLIAAQYGTQLAQTFWGSSSTGDSRSDLWEMLSTNFETKVSLSLQKVGDKVIKDLAVVTANYLKDQPELAEDYVLAIVNDSDSGWEAKALRVSDLTADLDDEKKTKVEEKLKEKRLLYFADSSLAPAASEDDEALEGLTERVQNFLDINQKLFDMLEKQGMIPWP